MLTDDDLIELYSKLVRQKDKVESRIDMFKIIAREVIDAYEQKVVADSGPIFEINISETGDYEGGFIDPLTNSLPPGRHELYSAKSFAAAIIRQRDIHIEMMRPISVEAIRSVIGSSDLKGRDGKCLVYEIESVAKAAFLNQNI